MSNLIVLPPPQRLQPVILFDPAHVLKLQTECFETLLIALRRLPGKDHRQFVIQSLTIITDLPHFALLPMPCLAEILFHFIETTTEARAILNLQDILIYVSQKLEGV